jgi:Ca2+-binding RTX toxin-like protein
MEEDPQLRQSSVIKDPKNKDFDEAFIGKDKKKDELNGSNKDDVLKGKGKSDIVKGSKGNDYLYGDKGGDILKGGKGADVLQGGRGKDELSGGGGKDIIYGGNSDDEISGNGGKDIFVLSRGKDIITDFKVGTDAIGLVYALDLKLKQKGDNLLIKTSDTLIHTQLLNVTRDEFLGDFSEANSYLQLPVVEVNVL